MELKSTPWKVLICPVTTFNEIIYRFQVSDLYNVIVLCSGIAVIKITPRLLTTHFSASVVS